MKVTYRNSDTTTIEIETSEEIAVTLTESYRKEDNRARAMRHWLPYPRLAAFSRANRARCTSQYTPSDRFGHPGYRQGRLGFLGILAPHNTINPRWL